LSNCRVGKLLSTIVNHEQRIHQLYNQIAIYFMAYAMLLATPT